MTKVFAINLRVGDSNHSASSETHNSSATRKAVYFMGRLSYGKVSSFSIAAVILVLQPNYPSIP